MKTKIDYKNDFAFRYILGSNTPDSIYLLTILIEGALNIKLKELHILNPELIPSQLDDKDMILDLRVKTDQNEEIDIEMQNSCFSETLRKRFQLYGAKLLSEQLKAGEPYCKLHHVSQIIFIDGMNKKTDELVDTYESRNKKGIREKESLLTRAYVQLPYINEMIKQKKIEEFSDFELAVYAFKNGFDDVIMNLKKKVIETMKEKIEKFNEDDKLRDIANKRMFGKMQVEGEKQEKYDEGYNLGKSEGFSKGLDESKQMIIDSLCIHIQSKFDEDIEPLLKDIEIERLIQLQGALFTANTIEEIKEFIQ